METVTCIAPVNIAVIKYWGKRDEELILPLNDSISSSLSTDYMCAKTTIRASPNFNENKFWLNGKEESFDNPRLANCLKDIKNRVQGDKEIMKWNIHICSENNFPTAAGLASSAAGYGCLVYALANLYGVEGDLSAFARRGSGSACRSVFGGWVQWHAGVMKDGKDSIATQIASASHWPEMRIIILVVNDSRKKYSSTSGMKQSVATSELLKYRVQKVVPDRITRMIQAINEKDFENFANITMQDSNQFHATCLDTFPPCVYMNDISHAIVDFVHSYNNYRGNTNVAYTFDAGPNACLYMLEQDVAEVVTLIQNVFPCGDNLVEYIKGMHVDKIKLSEDVKRANFQKHDAGCLKYIIHTRVGDGPKVLNTENDCLLNEAGLPKHFL